MEDLLELLALLDHQDQHHRNRCFHHDGSLGMSPHPPLYHSQFIVSSPAHVTWYLCPPSVTWSEMRSIYSELTRCWVFWFSFLTISVSVRSGAAVAREQTTLSQNNHQDTARDSSLAERDVPELRREDSFTIGCWEIFILKLVIT